MCGKPLRATPYAPCRTSKDLHHFLGHQHDLGEDRPVFGVPQQIVQEIRPAATLDDGFMFTAPQDLPWMQHVFQPLGTPLALLMATEEA